MQTLSTLPGIAPDRLALPALACAVTFPTAIVGSIATLLLLKRIFRIIPYGRWQNSLRKIAARLNHSNAEHSRY